MPARYLETLEVPPDQLQPYPGNAKLHDGPALEESVRRNGQFRAVLARRLPDGTLQLLAGHGTTTAVHQAGAGPVRVEVVDADDDEARRIVLADNALGARAGYDEQALLDLLDEAKANGGFPGTGYDEDLYAELLGQVGSENPHDWQPDGEGAGEAGERPSLADRFLIPPFDVLDARQGWWAERKRAWLSLNMASEVGRDEGLAYQSPTSHPGFYEQKEALEGRLGRKLTTAEFTKDHYTPTSALAGGTSIFDPVLCELTYRWFSAPGHTVLDPFAGGSVRGLVAAILGRGYLGNDLRPEQVTANQQQGADFTARGLIPTAPTWTCGDSADWVQTLPPDSTDLLFSCPPYLWLEKYSDDPADLSNSSEADFETLYTAILTGAARALRPDRYAVLVVGDVRDPRTGRLVDLRGITVRACEAAGLHLASAAVLVTPVGSLAVRAARAFEATRTLGRTHQDVLVFVKGNRTRAATACGTVDLTDVPLGETHE